MNERPNGFPSLNHWLPILNRVSNETCSAQVVELLNDFHFQLDQSLTDALRIQSDRPEGLSQFNYRELAVDYKSRDVLRSVHYSLSDCLKWIRSRPFRAGEQISRECVRVLREISTKAITGDYWTYGIAFQMAAKAIGNVAETDLRDASHAPVMDIVRRIHQGTSWYDPSKEKQPGGWFTTFFIGWRCGFVIHTGPMRSTM